MGTLWGIKPRGLVTMAACALLLSACGGGGGGGNAIRPDGDGNPNPGVEPTPSVDSAPVSTNGSGVVVAVLDSGVRTSHDEFDNGARVLTGYNVADGNADVSDIDPHSHGTRVASVALGSSVGVAPGATLLPVRIIKADDTFTTDEIAAGIDYARSRHAPINNISATVYDTTRIRNAVESAAAADILTVAAAGNDGDPDPIPAPLLANVSANAVAHFLVVGAVDDSDRIVSWSDRAGSAMNRYLVARGTSVLSAVADGDDWYGTASGTSFSSPQVAGAAALVKGADPALSMAEVASILLRTADDLGDPGVDAVYGWGKLNPVRALEPVGALAIPDTKQASGSAMPVSATSLRLGPAFGDALQTAPQLARVVALDDFRRPYAVDVRSAVQVDHRPFALADRMAASASREEQVAATLPGMQLSASLRFDPEPAPDDASRWEDASAAPVDRSLALTGGGSDLSWQYLYGVAPGSQFGAGARADAQQLQWLTADGLGNAYLDLAGTGSQGVALGTGFNGGATLRAGFFTGRNPRARDDLDVRAGVIETAFQAGGLQLRLLASQVHEQAGVLGSAGAGALATGRQALTDSVGVSGQWRLGAGVSVLAHYQTGRTRVQAQPLGLLRDWSAIDSDAWGFGVMRRGVFGVNDFAGLAYSQPLRVRDGAVTIDAPIQRTLDRRLQRTTTRIDLTPSGAERDLELAYGYGAHNGTQFDASLAYRMEPGHVGDAAAEWAAMFRYRRPF